MKKWVTGVPAAVIGRQAQARDICWNAGGVDGRSSTAQQWYKNDLKQAGLAHSGFRAAHSVQDIAVALILTETENSNTPLSLKLDMAADLMKWTYAGRSVEWRIPVDGAENQFYRIRSGK